MRKILITLLLFTVPTVLRGQRIPEEEEILAATVDAASPYYYPSLMLRYEKGDTTLTQDDYYYLYYGYALQDAYKPLEPIAAEANVLMIIENNTEELSREGAAELLRYAADVMMRDPFSPSNINFMTYAYGILGDSVNERISADRFEKVLSAIESSGTGLKENSPRHILWFSHAADLLAARGLRIAKRTVRTKTVEYIQLAERDGDAKGYFFDFSRIYSRKPDTPVLEREKGGFEVNGIPVGRRVPGPSVR